MKRFFSSILFIAFSISYFSVIAQSDLKIGQWKSYLPYRTSKYITQSSSKVYYATPFSVIHVDKNTDEIEVLSKVEGLSDAGVQIIKYNKFNEILLVAYSNGNIDLVKKDGEIQNIRDILDNINVIGDKKIYDIYIENSSAAYLACGFGLVKFNMLKGEFEFTTFTSDKINAVTILDNYLYIATDNGIFRTLNDANANLADFKNWTLLGKNEGFPSTYNSKSVCGARGKLYLGINDSLCVWQNNKITKIQTVNTDVRIGNISAEDKNILYSFIQKDESRKWGGYFGYINEKDEPVLFSNNSCISHIFNAVEDEKGSFWIADSDNNFKRLENISGNQATCKSFSYNSPYNYTASEIAIGDDNTVWVASGTIFNGNGTANYDGFYHFADGKWDFTNATNDPIMKSGYTHGAQSNQPEIRDCNRVVVDKKTRNAYIASFWAGLLEVSNDNKILNFYTNTNSILKTANGDPGSTRVTGLAFDKKGTLWMSNNLSSKSVVALTSEGKWYSMGSAMGSQSIFQCVIDPINSYKWFVVRNNGLLVYDEGKDITSEADDRYAFINTSNSNLPSNNVNCLEVDLDGRIWVGTDNGVAYFSCGSSLFDKKESCKGFLPISTLDGIPEYLLRYNNISSIAVDGANRKWFGTSNGFFIQSPDGTEKIAEYNTENSPLFDNIINDIAINSKTGEVFISTNKGLQSLKTDALGGNATHSNIVVYPNPIRPDYDGVIAIKGLAEDSKVKITDINGRLLYETDALGGQAIWDGKDYNGRKAETGVYYIFSTYTKNLDYPDDAAAKLLIVK